MDKIQIRNELGNFDAINWFSLKESLVTLHGVCMNYRILTVSVPKEGPDVEKNVINWTKNQMLMES